MFRKQESDVQFLAPNKNNIIRKKEKERDNDIDYDIDQGLIQTKKEPTPVNIHSETMQNQFLYDLKNILNEQIISALNFLKTYEDIYEIYIIIYKAYTDLTKGKSHLLTTVPDSIIEQISLVYRSMDLNNFEIGFAIHNALIRSCRYIHSQQKKQIIKNKESYYYNNIQNELIILLQQTWKFNYTKPKDLDTI